MQAVPGRNTGSSLESFLEEATTKLKSEGARWLEGGVGQTGELYVH
jgi:hypothetical protein